jgi:hypothetical protein
MLATLLFYGNPAVFLGFSAVIDLHMGTGFTKLYKFLRTGLV